MLPDKIDIERDQQIWSTHLEHLRLPLQEYQDDSTGSKFRQYIRGNKIVQ